MCKDERITARLKKGVAIDAPFPRNLELVHKVLIKDGYEPQHDFLHIVNQYENQLTVLKYIKSTPFWDPETGEKYVSRHFNVSMPDRYIPTKKSGRLPKGLIRSEEDI